MKNCLSATALPRFCAGAAHAEKRHEVEIGIILGFTGPIESLTPMMAAGAELAMTKSPESGNLLDGAMWCRCAPIRTCIDVPRPPPPPNADHL